MVGRNKMMMVVLIGTWTIFLVKAGQPSISYVRNIALGNFLVAKGLSLSQQDVFANFTLANSCECRTACWCHSQCIAAAAMERPDGTVLCSLSAISPRTSIFLNITQSTYFFWEDSHVGLSYGLGSDNFLYFISYTTHVYSEGKDLCARVPGHRLAMLKTAAQFNAAEKLANGTKVLVDLSRPGIIGTPMVWGDGSPYTTAGSVSSVASIQDDQNNPVVYRLEPSRFNDVGLADATYRVLCQANPLGLDW
ncbi:uncharacterized protein [Procambarus clarkii]|uniref:uncharacterized protein n=1 Tax=Procambarus clarkii TaxID=6728 RepID=UPI0037430332